MDKKGWNIPWNRFDRKDSIYRKNKTEFLLNQNYTPVHAEGYQTTQKIEVVKFIELFYGILKVLFSLPQTVTFRGDTQYLQLNQILLLFLIERGGMYGKFIN